MFATIWQTIDYSDYTAKRKRKGGQVTPYLCANLMRLPSRVAPQQSPIVLPAYPKITNRTRIAIRAAVFFWIKR